MACNDIFSVTSVSRSTASVSVTFVSRDTSCVFMLLLSPDVQCQAFVSYFHLQNYLKYLSVTSVSRSGSQVAVCYDCPQVYSVKYLSVASVFRSASQVAIC